MFKKLKERIESVDDIGVPKRPPGLAVRSPPAENEERSIIDELIASELSETKRDSLASKEEPEEEINNEVQEEPQNEGLVEEKIKENAAKKEDTDGSETSSKVSELQSVLAQLSNELSSVRHQYDTLVVDSEAREEELRSEVIQLEAQLDQKSESNTNLEGKVTELSWTVENLTSRLQLYSSLDENEIVKKLQKEVSEVNSNHRESNLEIELLETRIAALTRKHHDEQTADSKTIRKLQEAASSLQKELKESSEEVARVTEVSRQYQKQFFDVNREKGELEKTVDQQKKKILKQEKEISELKLTHAYEMEFNNEQHQRVVSEMEEKLRDVKAKLKDKEEQLKRIVTELPDQPITKAVLDGYSRTTMVTSFSNTIVAPGTVLKRDNQPVIIMDEIDDEPAILPVDNVSIETEYEFSHHSQALLLNEVRTLRSENEQLLEEARTKDQTIRVQQQKISDMRKALSKGLKPQDPPPKPPSSLRRNTEPAAIPVMRLAIASEVNFQYLKNVVLRFICSREDEASQLLRAISTLLELSPDEEKYINDYLQYKMSWFGSMPAPPNISIKT